MSDTTTVDTVKRWSPVEAEWRGLLLTACTSVIERHSAQMEPDAPLPPPTGALQTLERTIALRAKCGVVVICVVRPSVLHSGIVYNVEHKGKEAIMGVIMPLSVWDEWWPAGATFADVMCDSILKDLRKTHGAWLVESNCWSTTDKAGEGPIGRFSLEFQVKRLE